MNLTCYIVDDEFHAIELLRSYIEKTPGLQLIGSATNPLHALQEVASSNAPDLTFLDVDMPELSGMEFAGLVTHYTKVIFTTSFREYAIEAFEKDAFDYLLKPISYERFLKAVTKLKRHLAEKDSTAGTDKSFFFIKSDIKGKMIRIVTNDITYIEAAQNYIAIHTGAARHMAYLSMEEIAEKLPDEKFIRVHRSFIINREKIRSVENGQVTLEDNTAISLGRLFKEPFLNSMRDLLIQSKRNSNG